MKKNLMKTALALAPAALVMFFTGCTNEELVSEQVTQYEKNFTETFGEIDPTHDWSMATPVTANIDLSNAPEGTYEVKIYSQKNGYLLKKAIVDGSAKLHFDAIKGENSVRILARKTSALGLTPINGYFPVENGVVNIAKEGTRAGDEEVTCNTTVGEQITDMGFYRDNKVIYNYTGETTTSQGNNLLNLPSDDNIYYIAKIDNENYANGSNGKYLVTYNGSESQVDMYGITDIIANQYRFYSIETKTLNSQSGLWDNSWNNLPDTRYEGNQYYGVYYRDVQVLVIPYSAQDAVPAHYTGQTTSVQIPYSGNFYYLNNVYQSIDESTQVSIADLMPLVSAAYPDPYFKEKEDNRTKYEDILQPDMEFVLKENGPITFTPVFHGTDYDDELGYFYWFETEDMTEEQIRAARNAAPRYIFMPHTMSNYVNATGEANITIYNGNSKEVPEGMRMPYLNWDQYVQNNAYVQGTTYHLAYFGENYDNPTGSFEFPEGLHVGFFFFASHKVNSQLGRGSGLFYTIEDMNLEDGVNDKHWYGTGGQASDGTWIGEDFTRPDRAAVNYSYNGTIVMGIEDDTDYDENDILIFVKAPVDPPASITEEIDVEMSWVVACEDLGGSYDYDFNDIVFDLGQVDVTYVKTTDEEGTTTSSTSVEKSELYLRPLAAGGTRKAYIYYDGENLGEIHDLLRKGAPSNVPINVGGSWDVDPTKVERIKLADIDLTNYDSSTTPEQYVSNVKAYVAQELQKIKIVVDNEGQKEATKVTAPREDGTNIPQMLLLPRGWDWPNEMVHIFSVYPQFKNWAENQEGNNGWITPPVGSYHTNPIK